MSNKLTKKERSEALEKSDTGAHLAIRRRAFMPLAMTVYEQAINMNKVIDRRLADLAQMKAQNFFDIGDFRNAVKFCLDPAKRAVFEQCREAFKMLDTPLCRCVSADNKTGEIHHLKQDTKGSFLAHMGKVVTFVYCSGCRKTFAVTYDDANPINYELEGILPPRKSKRQIDNKQGKDVLLLKAAQM